MFLCLLNGQTVSADKMPSMQFGDGLFETIAIRQNQPCLWHQHIARLQTGCQRLGFPSINAGQLLQEIQRLALGQKKAVIKIIITPTPVERGYQRPNPLILNRWVQLYPWPSQSFYHTDLPANLQLCETRLGKQPLLAGMKHLNRLEQILARAELAEDRHEGIMLDQDGWVVEGIMSNLLLRFGGRYVTPSIENCGVAGVVRESLLMRAKQQKLALSVRPVTLDGLVQADQLFIMNALLGIRPVARFAQHTYTQTSLPLALQAAHTDCFLPTIGPIV